MIVLYIKEAKKQQARKKYKEKRREGIQKRRGVLEVFSFN
jgi:hypothetical protein